MQIQYRRTAPTADADHRLYSSDRQAGAYRHAAGCKGNSASDGNAYPGANCYHPTDRNVNANPYPQSHRNAHQAAHVRAGAHAPIQ